MLYDVLVIIFGFPVGFLVTTESLALQEMIEKLIKCIL